MRTYNVLGVPISAVTLEKAHDNLIGWSRDAVGRFVCIRDVHGIVQARDNPNLMSLHYEASMVTPDGMPLVWLGKLSGLPVSRTCGPDLFDYVLDHGRRSGLRHYLYGGKENVADQLRIRFQEKYPGVEIVGAQMPPFHSLSEEELDDLITDFERTKPHIVWIGISTPRQEFLMKQLAARCPLTFIGVGAAFDFHSGAIKRAPTWMQKSGLEWCFRLVTEPRRLWKRYLIMAPRFLYLLLISFARG